MVLINTKMFVMSYRCLYLVLNTFGESLNPFMAFSINFRNFPLRGQQKEVLAWRYNSQTLISTWVPGYLAVG